MKISHSIWLPALGVLALIAAPLANAQCGGLSKALAKHTAFESMRGPSGAHLLRAALTEDEASAAQSVVGMWHVKFIAEGNSGIPDGAEIDAGFAQWHSDGTEIMNSGGRAPSTTSFCLGVWAKVGTNKYELNHYAISWDPTPTTADPTGTILGPARIKETLTLGSGGNELTGSFTITQYDESLNVLANVVGKIVATRVTVNTTPSPVF